MKKKKKMNSNLSKLQRIKNKNFGSFFWDFSTWPTQTNQTYTPETFILFLHLRSLIILGLFAYGSYLIIIGIIDYTKYKSVIDYQYIIEKQSLFPTISICAFPNFNKTQQLNDAILRFQFDDIYYTNLTNYFEEYNDTVYGKCLRFNSGINIYNQTYDLFNSTLSGRLNWF